MQLLVPSLSGLSPAHRKLIAEIAMVRLFFLVENCTESMCCKMLCGASYVDGSLPLRLVSAKSIQSAHTQMRTFGRAQPPLFLSWNQSKEIRDNLRYTLGATDPLFATVVKHAGILTEMRYVRNHIAHGSSSTRIKFNHIVTQYFGGLRRGMTPGLLLLTPAAGVGSLLQKYIISCRVIIKELCRA